MPSFQASRVQFVSSVLLVVLFSASAIDTAGNRASMNFVKKEAVVRPANDFVEKVHIVFMNHLDVGYASMVNNIINEYFDQYFPLAITIANQLSAGGYVETFTYTTHPWLVSLYMDCPPNLVLAGVKLHCPTAAAKAAFVSAVQKGYINWHAGPMNIQPELAEPWLFEAALDLSAGLDAKFNITRTGRVLSQRDVPGMTQGVIPSLIKKGVMGVSVGVNNQCPPPQVPAFFVWHYDGQSILAAWHPGGYPDNPGPNPSDPYGLSRHDCVVVDGFTDALCFAFRTDNSGPPTSVQEILGYYEILRAEFPNAELKASRLEDFFVAAESIKDQLPVVTSEIGDEWIQGVASDPRKCAEFRAVSRVLRVCLDSGKCLYSDARVWNATRFLMKVTEHTWGYENENDQIHWTNEEFYKLRQSSSNFVYIANSWVEQRMFVNLTVDALADHSVVKDIQAELEQLVPKTPDLTNYIKVIDTSKVFSCPKGAIKALQFGPDGSIYALNYNGVDWASSDFNLASFVYTTYNETDYKVYGQVMYYYKKNVTINAEPESKTWPISVTALYTSNVSECDFYVSLALQDSRAVSYYGAPSTVWLRYTVRQKDTAGVDIEFQWFDKSITRLTEALSLSFKVKPRAGFKWWISKMDQFIDPNNVVFQGSQNQHVLDDMGAVFFQEGTNSNAFQVRSFDVPLASPLTATHGPRIFPGPLDPIKEEVVGLAFNVYNNVWNTNYIMWYPYVDGDANFKARFAINLV